MLDGFTELLRKEDAIADNKRIIFEAIDATQVAPVVRNICLLSTDDGLAPSEREDLETNLKELELTSGMNKDQQKQAVYDAVINKEKENLEESGGYII